MDASETLKIFDRRFRDRGIRYLCGVDEAGRGPLAGPVVAAAVVLPEAWQGEGINDSKKLSIKARERLAEQIRQQAISFGIGMATVEEIHQLNILQATFKAMQRAVAALRIKPEFVLVDGRDFPILFANSAQVALPGQAVIGGDCKSLSIAAASILAKVYRDRLMVEYAKQFPGYGFERHKGYGTPFHRKKIVELGPCPIHREKFIRKLLNVQRSLFD